MVNLNTLNNLIAVVVVILTLSLIVQAIQGLFKKLLAIKSAQLEASLVDLFEHVLGAELDPDRPTWWQKVRKAAPAKRASVRDGFLRNAPVLRQLLWRGPLKNQASQPTRELMTAVLGQFQRMGRVSQEASAEVMPAVIAYRRDIHEHPELVNRNFGLRSWSRTADRVGPSSYGPELRTPVSLASCGAAGRLSSRPHQLGRDFVS